jgi:hypothetical protein
MSQLIPNLIPLYVYVFYDKWESYSQHLPTLKK